MHHSSHRWARQALLINVQGLFKQGMAEAADKQLKAGLDEGWSLNAAVYEQLILGLCQLGNTTEATRMLNRMDVRLSADRRSFNLRPHAGFHCRNHGKSRVCRGTWR